MENGNALETKNEQVVEEEVAVKKERKKRIIISIVFSIVSVAIVAMLSSLFTKLGKDWYQGLTKPPFDPPGYVFSVAWTIIYVMLAIALYFALIKGVSKKLAVLLVINGVLQVLWTLMFFTFHSTVMGFIVLVLLIFETILVVKELFASSKVSFYLFVPYLLWLCFALILNYSIIMLN